MFEQNVATVAGGSILIQDVDAEIQNSSFLNNTVLFGSGGALMMSCSMDNQKGKGISIKLSYIVCQFLISSNSFTNNSAKLKGGAIYYDLYSPAGL